MKIYYAHHMYKYGTEIEKFEIELIKEKLKNCKILNPNGDINFSNCNNGEEEMNLCYENLSSCDAIVFSSLSGIIGKGVFGEVMYANRNDKDIYYIENDEIKKVEDFKFKILNRSNRIYAKINNIEFKKVVKK